MGATAAPDFAFQNSKRFRNSRGLSGTSYLSYVRVRQRGQVWFCVFLGRRSRARLHVTMDSPLFSCPMSLEELDHFDISFRDSPCEGTVLHFVLRIHLGSLIEKKLHHLETSSHCGGLSQILVWSVSAISRIRFLLTHEAAFCGISIYECLRRDSENPERSSVLATAASGTGPDPSMPESHIRRPFCIPCK